MTNNKLKKKAYIPQNECVACGCCVKVCPMSAIHVEKGVFAIVNEELCVGCGKCIQECPASIITAREVI